MITRSAAMRAAASCVAVVAVVGCTATTTTTPSPSTTVAPSKSSTTLAPSASSTATPSPATTWSEEQQAALDAVNGYLDVSETIGADPSKFTERQMTNAFKKYIGGDMVEANVASFMRLKRNGWRYVGDVTILSTKITKVIDNHNSRGLEAHVTTCRDQSQRRIVDADGELADTDQPPKFNLRQFSVRMPAGSNGWRVYGLSTANGKCGS